MFIGRNSELKRLERMYASGKLEFATVYGRRRVGKTTLINKFISDKKYIFLACQKSSEEDNLIELSKQISIYIGYSVSFSSFIEALRAIVHYALAERLIFVMDEFPYLAKKNDNAVSIGVMTNNPENPIKYYVSDINTENEYGNYLVTDEADSEFVFKFTESMSEQTTFYIFLKRVTDPNKKGSGILKIN